MEQTKVPPFHLCSIEREHDNLALSALMVPAEALPISHELSIQLNKPEMDRVNSHPLVNL